ncbi:MAG: hypothetical protein ABSC15_16730 [Terriglobales bacterium]|jgi:hypothetical protein
MFEAELEMERRSSFLPLLLMTCLVVAIAGMVAYVVIQVRSKTPLSAQEASGIVAPALQGPGAAVIHFHTGLIKPNVSDDPGDAHYRLLEKAGIVKLAKVGVKENISLTPAGERLLTAIPDTKKWKETDGSFAYQVPLAQRQLVSVTNITMRGVNNATVEYAWKWVPNQLGDVFDAGGSLVKGFNIWDRQNLINKFEADFYHGNPTKSTLTLARTDHGWKISAE